MKQTEITKSKEILFKEYVKNEIDRLLELFENPDLLDDYDDLWFLEQFYNLLSEIQVNGV